MLNITEPGLQDALQAMCRLAQHVGGRALVVGGSVRDALLGVPAKDLDVEVYGIAPDELKARLAERFPIDLVGESFGVIKLRGLPIDVSVPRRESRIGPGHRDFDVDADPGMTLEEASLRRDFTINAMAYDPLEKRLYDFHGGELDLRERRLRHVSERFKEDPLRVLRGMQFAARFELIAVPGTIEFCNTMTSAGLARERVFEEWKKLILKGVKPSMGLEFLRQSGWLRDVMELEALVNCEQEPDWHPEGDVWTHSLLSLDAYAEERIGDEREDLIVGFAVLCHDFGKPLTTEFREDRLRSYGHCEAGEQPTRAFLGRMTDQADLIDAVVALVRNHMCVDELYGNRAGDTAIRRLASRVKRIDRLVRVATADRNGRGRPEKKPFPAGDWVSQRAEALAVRDAEPVRIVMGRHLIELGLKPGPHFGRILAACYEAQLDGIVTDLEQGVALVKSMQNA